MSLRSTLWPSSVALPPLPLVLLFLLPLASSLPSLPSSTVASVQRRPALPDLIRPSFCPPSCEALFSARPSNFSTSGDARDNEEDGCACECPAEAPAYLHTAGYCIEKLDECPSAIDYEPDVVLGGSRSFAVPVVSLPAPGGLLFARGEIRWSDELLELLGAPSSGDFFPACSISEIFVDSPIHRWTPYDSIEDFQLLNDENGQPAIMFNGSSEDAVSLGGVILQLKVACEAPLTTTTSAPSFRDIDRDTPSAELLLARDEKRAMPRMCIAIRITGECAVPFVSQRFASAPHLESVLLGLLAVILLLALAGSCLGYHVCWRLKKRRLIGELHMQFLVHFKQAQAQQMMSPPPQGARLPRSYSPNGEEMDGSQFKPPQPLTQKRRLYFSAEFFEPEAMANPPAVAEQFVGDLRRMIDMAKERIRMRRHHPRLDTIEEIPEAEELHEVSVEVPPPVPEEEEEMSPAREPAEESPRSGKSVDSGRESIADSSGGSSDESTTSGKGTGEEDDDEGDDEAEEDSEGTRDGPSSAPPSLPSGPDRPDLGSATEDDKDEAGVRQLIAGFEQRSSSGKRSAIPVPPRSPSRPSLPRTTTATPTTAPSLIPRLGQSSPRPLPRSLALATAIPMPSDDLPESPSYTTRRTRKGYAVFPVDAMLNKSLPRRPKRRPPEDGAITQRHAEV